MEVYLDEACCRVPSLLKMFLPVLLLDFESKAGAQDALHRVNQTAHKLIGDFYLRPDQRLKSHPHNVSSQTSQSASTAETSK